mmetsp:Transcript_120634/g.189236  ORF Transcript_120634/g.189236 Transcript_120634/m.189236 type:complete len:226 (+) Transcript_120634:1146-1823(+)
MCMSANSSGSGGSLEVGSCGLETSVFAGAETFVSGTLPECGLETSVFWGKSSNILVLNSPTSSRCLSYMGSWPNSAKSSSESFSAPASLPSSSRAMLRLCLAFLLASFKVRALDESSSASCHFCSFRYAKARLEWSIECKSGGITLTRSESLSRSQMHLENHRMQRSICPPAKYWLPLSFACSMPALVRAILTSGKSSSSFFSAVLTPNSLGLGIFVIVAAANPF